MIQKQTWKDEIRILITDEENLGSVQISIPLYVSDIFGKADALIYALWVNVVHRRNGVAQRLLQLAEQQAKLNGDWKPDWNSKECKHNIMRTSEYGITSSSDYNEGAIYFKNKEDAQAVIDNPNFRSILDAIYKD